MSKKIFGLILMAISCYSCASWDGVSKYFDANHFNHPVHFEELTGNVEIVDVSLEPSGINIPLNNDITVFYNHIMMSPEFQTTFLII